MYAVSKYHFQPCYVRGDLSSEQVLEKVDHFKTLKEAKAFIDRNVNGRLGAFAKKTTSGYGGIYFTDKTWVEENTGEKRTEKIWYEAKKI